MCDTGHLHNSSLTCSKHGHHQNHKISLRLHLTITSAKSVYWAKINFESVNNMKTYSEL